jgi:3-hydroxyisobutyrate dehydrogenase-like beta-hydroxyacid dehydrogenase
MTRIGFTGVGRMGLPMCAILVRADTRSLLGTRAVSVKAQ